MDPLLPGDGNEHPPTPNAPPPRAKQITCEFCRCHLTPNGDYLALSDEAKAFRLQGEKIEELKRQIAIADTDLGAAIRERDEARAEVRRLSEPAAKPGFWRSPA